MSCMSLTNTLHLILDLKRGDFRYDVINTCIKFIKGDRHLHEIFNESIIFMSHFSIGRIDIHKKISLRNFFSNSKWPLSLGSKNRKNFPA